MGAVMQATFGKITPYLHWGDTKLNNSLHSYSKKQILLKQLTCKQFYNTERDFTFNIPMK